MKKIINLFVLGLLVTGLSSCLKDKSLTLPDADGAIKNVVEFQNVDFISSGTSSIYPVYIKSFDIKPTGELTIAVNYAGVDAAPENIAVKVALDLSIIDKYNAKIIADARAAAIILGEDPDEAEDDVQGELFTPLSTSLYTLPSMDLTIPAGQRTASFKVALKPDLFSFSLKTALSFKIISSSTGVVSGNFGNIIVGIVAKNAYDGVYKYQSSATQSLRPNANDTGSNAAELVTSGPNTVTTPLVNYYTAPGNLLTYQIDPATNKVTVLNGGIGTPITDPSSNWNPATKVLFVKWTAGARKFEETYTYIGSR